MASSLPQLQPWLGRFLDCDRTYRTLGLQMTRFFFYRSSFFARRLQRTIWAEKGGQFSLFEHVFLHISATSWFRISSFKNGIHFSTNHHGHPPSLAFRNMNQAQQQYGGQKQYMYNASMTLKNQGNDHIKAIRERCEPLKGKLPWKFMEHDFFIYL